MGAAGFIATAQSGWNKPHERTFDMLLCTASHAKGFDLNAYLSLLRVHGRFISVGLPPAGEDWNVNPMAMLGNGCLIGTTHLGSRRETLDMLQLAADKGIRSWVETIPVGEKGCGEARTSRVLATVFSFSANCAVERLQKNDVRYRFTLVDYDKQFH